MNAIILAAGFGSRLMPLTKDKPKCMVEYKGKKIIDYEIESMLNAKIDKIAVVGGYKADVLLGYLRSLDSMQNIESRFYINKNYATTNMVATLFCGRDFLLQSAAEKKDVIVSYADIIYGEKILNALMESNSELSILVDDSWQSLWQARFSDILSDAETLKIQNNKIKELGKKAQSLADIDSQYMGLFKISHTFLDTLIRFYDSLDRSAKYDGKEFSQMYMTSFLQGVIDKYDNATPVRINGGWLEIDSPSDLEISVRLYG